MDRRTVGTKNPGCCREVAVTNNVLFCLLGDRLKLLVHNTRSDMSRTVEDFTVRIKALVEDLKAKHAKERLTLLNRLKSIPRAGRKYSTTLSTAVACVADGLDAG